MTKIQDEVEDEMQEYAYAYSEKQHPAGVN